MADSIEHELCANCKKEIPQANYLMHTTHCARNFALCPICKEAVPKTKLEDHKKKRHSGGPRSPPVQQQPPSLRGGAMPKLANGTAPVPVRNATTQLSRATVPEKLTNGVVPRNDVPLPRPDPNKGLLPCRYCDLELPKLDLENHEEYCGTRTDKCIECGEFVMFKYKKLHEDSNHGFIKLSDEPGPRPSWDSSTQRSTSSVPPSSESSYASRRSRLPPLQPFDMTSLYNMADYIPRSTGNPYSTPGGPSKKDKGDSYKELSRRIDCKTEYIKNLLHDSASITAPLRSTGTQPRNHFNHQKGQAPLPPSRRRNPPTELTIPCEFCDVPIPHEELIQHETGCRPDLARFNPRRLAPDEDDYFVAPPPASPEVELPCEFCCDMIPASQLLGHQSKCN